MQFAGFDPVLAQAVTVSREGQMPVRRAHEVAQRQAVVEEPSLVHEIPFPIVPVEPGKPDVVDDDRIIARAAVHDPHIPELARPLALAAAAPQVLPAGAEPLDPEVLLVGHDHAAVGEPGAAADSAEEVLVRPIEPPDGEHRFGGQAYFGGRSGLGCLGVSGMRCGGERQGREGGGWNRVVGVHGIGLPGVAELRGSFPGCGQSPMGEGLLNVGRPAVRPCAGLSQNGRTG